MFVGTIKSRKRYFLIIETVNRIGRTKKTIFVKISFCFLINIFLMLNFTWNIISQRFIFVRLFISDLSFSLQFLLFIFKAMRTFITSCDVFQLNIIVKMLNPLSKAEFEPERKYINSASTHMFGNSFRL